MACDVVMSGQRFLICRRSAPVWRFGPRLAQVEKSRIPLCDSERKGYIVQCSPRRDRASVIETPTEVGIPTTERDDAQSEFDPAPTGVQIWRCGYLAPSRTARCYMRSATIVLRQMDAASRPVRQ